MSKVAIYLRVSTKDQSTESQLTAIKAYCNLKEITAFDVFRDEGISGTKESRPALDALMSRVRNKEISTVIVYSFSRFARSARQLLTALDEFNAFGISFVSISEQLDSNTPHGRLVFSILSAIAELERHMIKSRVIAGLQNAKANGKKLGAPKKQINFELLKELLNQKMSYQKISKLTGVSPSTICRLAKEISEKSAA